MSTAAIPAAENLAGQSEPVVPTSRREQYTPLSLIDELYFADWPHRTEQNQNMHKYDLRAWLIGYAIIHRWTYSPHDVCQYKFALRRDGVTVEVELQTGGLRMSDGIKERFIKTVY